MPLKDTGKNIAAHTATKNDSTIFDQHILPILQAKCVYCHNDLKKKGGLSLSSYDMMLKGGVNGTLWNAGNPTEQGLLLHLINLPEADKKHMPPAGTEQLTQGEIALLTQWIKSGASSSMVLADLKPGDALATSLNRQTKKTVAAADEYYMLPQISNEKIKGINNDFLLLERMGDTSQSVHASIFNAAFYKTAYIAQLLNVKENLIELDLSNIPITDKELDTIGKLAALRKLNLSNTKITASGLKKISKLQNLSSLSVTGTMVDKRLFNTVLKLKNLKKLFIWNTPIEPHDIKNMQRYLPKMLINTGFEADSVIANIPQVSVKRASLIFKDTLHATLESVIKGAVIKYTLNGKDPDTVSNAYVYDKPIFSDIPVTVTARAYLQGWEKSKPAKFAFTKSRIPLNNIKIYRGRDTITHQSDSLKRLFDDAYATTDTADFTRLNDSVFVIDIDTRNLEPFTKIFISGLTHLPSGSFPADTLVVSCYYIWWGKVKNNITIAPRQPSGKNAGLIDRNVYEVPVESVVFDRVKIMIKPKDKIPAWHPAAGKPAGVLIDEIWVE